MESLVHWLENVDGDPTKVRTACGKFLWTRCSFKLPLLDPKRVPTTPVTCPECLVAMLAIADQPTVVEAI
jgi:hypothetical protein